MKTFPVQQLLALYIATLAIGLAGCSTTGHLVPPSEANISAVYGYIDMSDAPTGLQWITMKKLQPRSDTPYYHFYVDDGMFYRSEIPPGTYKFWEFGGFSQWKNTDYTFQFQGQGKGEMDRVIDRQGLYFAGCYRYTRIKTGFFSPNKFDLEPIEGDCERETLERLARWSKDATWNRLISQRLSELRPVATSRP